MNHHQSLAIAAYYLFYAKKKRKKPKHWHKEWLGDYQRLTYSFSHQLEPLIFQNSEDVRSYIRVDSEVYRELLNLVTPYIQKQDTNYRLAISPKEKLSITLSYLAEGVSMKRLHYEYRAGVSTVSKIIEETLDALLTTLVPKVLTMPQEESEWLAIADRFSTEWQFPNCIGALDGKHILMFPPRNSGSLYFNYKEGFSIVLLALVDADYKFIGVDVGANGKCSDTGIWSQSPLREAFANNNFASVPPAHVLPKSTLRVPYIIVADSGFPLEEFVMRPFGMRNITPRQQVFNYRLSRARRVSENAFGMMANRWRILLSRMLASPEKATRITTVCCALHNLLCSKNETKVLYIPEGFADKEDENTGEVIPGLWRKLQLPNLEPVRCTNAPAEATLIRNKLKDYFNEEGRIHWQNKYAFK